MTRPAAAYPFNTLPVPFRLAFALGLVGAVFVLDRYAGPLLDDGSHFILLGTAVMAVAWLAGTGAALAATVFAAVLGTMPSSGVSDSPVHLHLALFLLHGLLVTAVVAELRRARRDAEHRALEAQAARQQSEAANRMKEEFLGTISHELRTPLNAVLGWVHLLRTGKLDSRTAIRGLESIDRNVRLQAQLTSDLLDVSKALTGKLRLDPRPSRAGRGGDAGGDRDDAGGEAKGVRIKLALPDDGIVVHGDPSRLRQIAWQLLANAIKFSARGGDVEIAVDVFGRDARLIVRDSGPGIDPTFLPRIFERFTQADPSPTRSAGGLGVGLALVRELVELHGGEIEARNREDGSGAIFMARFPLQSVEALQVATPLAIAAPAAGNGIVRCSTACACWCSTRKPKGATCCGRCCSIAARRSRPSARSTTRSRRSRRGAPTCWSATACRRSTTSMRWSARCSRSRASAAAASRRWR